MEQHRTVIDFWFRETEPPRWFAKDPAFDRLIRARFQALHASAARGELWAWRASPEGRLAEILVLDQFSRNIYRDSPPAFAQDATALVLAQEAISAGADRDFDPPRKAFLYMPFMHSESPLIHERAVELFSAPGLESNLAYELRHRAIIQRFGRYPHRNAILGRASTTEEQAFLAEPGSSF
jgi:uncharacterized protein (DUF924 family)